MQGKSILSVDVEDYFQVEAFNNIVDKSQWGLFAAWQVKAAFFLLEGLRICDIGYVVPNSDRDPASCIMWRLFQELSHAC